MTRFLVAPLVQGGYQLLRQEDDVKVSAVGLLADEDLAVRIAVLLTREGMEDVPLDALPGAGS